MPLTPELTRKKYELDGIFCASCLDEIEEEISGLPQVMEVMVNSVTGSIIVSGEDSKIDNIDRKIEEIVDRIEPGVEVKEIGNVRNSTEEDKGEVLSSAAEIEVDSKTKEAEISEENTEIDWLLGLGTILLVLNIIIFSTGIFPFLQIPGLKIFLYFTAYGLIGRRVIRSAIVNIKDGRFFSEYFLMTVATIGAFAIGEYTEAVAVMLFYMIGEMFQHRATDSSRHSIKKLMDINPDYAHLKLNGEIKKVSPEEVNVGDKIVVKPGERIPLDGEVIAGESYLDTSALTGESIPKRVERGDQVFSGVINQDGLLTIQVSKKYGESTVKRILDLVENAAGRKAPVEKFITRFSRYYTPAVVYTALGIAILPPLIIPGAIFSSWIYRALVFLVISCPCALVLSIPLGIFGGIGRASREGILVKGGNYLEGLNDVKTVVFDKTGTLTRGVFEVEEVIPASGFTEEEVLLAAAGAEKHSSHPIAGSIREAYKGYIDEGGIESYRELSGRGVIANVRGKEILVGNHKLMDQEGIKGSYRNTDDSINVAINGVFAGQIEIRDEIKSDARETVLNLRKQDIEKIVMLTGDSKLTANKVAAKLGLDEYYAELLPDEKVDRVEKLLSDQKSGDKLAFVGDGINDAPVLARSDIGIAMGGLGSDAAIEAADIVLTDDKPGKLPVALQLAAKTRRIVRQNIVFTLGVKGAVLVLGLWGLASMWGAVFADVGVSLLAVINSLRILRDS